MLLKAVLLSIRLSQKIMFISHTRAHKYVDSLMLHSPTRGFQFLTFFFDCHEKSGKKKWAKATLKKEFLHIALLNF